jgi:TatA/E family protein of Tat protein translocase
MGNLGFQELFVVGLVALLVLGPRRVPELAKALGEGVRAFRKALHADDESHQT